MGSDSAAFLILRAWTEGEGGDRLRVRITCTSSADPSVQRSRVVATAGDACEAVRGWLEDFVESASAGRGDDEAVDQVIRPGMLWHLPR